MAGLESLRLKDDVARLRGIDLGDTEVDQKLELGRRFAPQSSGTKVKAFNTRVPQSAGKRGGGRGRGGRGGDRGRRPAEAEGATATAEAPAPEASQAPAA